MPRDKTQQYGSIEDFPDVITITDAIREKGAVVIPRWTLSSEAIARSYALDVANARVQYPTTLLVGPLPTR